MKRYPKSQKIDYSSPSYWSLNVLSVMSFPLKGELLSQLVQLIPRLEKKVAQMARQHRGFRSSDPRRRPEGHDVCFAWRSILCVCSLDPGAVKCEKTVISGPSKHRLTRPLKRIQAGIDPICESRDEEDLSLLVEDMKKNLKIMTIIHKSLTVRAKSAVIRAFGTQGPRFEPGLFPNAWNVPLLSTSLAVWMKRILLFSKEEDEHSGVGSDGPSSSQSENDLQEDWASSTCQGT